jgi:M3 family oligoendopeptidase
MSSFEDIANPSDAALAESYRHIQSLLGQGPHEAALRDAFSAWEGVRRTWTSYANLTRLRFAQDTTQDDRREAQRALDERIPRVTALEVGAKQHFLQASVRRPLEHDLGAHAFDVWSADVACFDEAIAADLIRESALTREYTQMLATATAQFGDEELTLSGLARYFTAADRETRHAAERARWSIFERHADRLDTIYDELVRLRDGMAKKLGFADFTALRYRRMRRVDYGPGEVAAYRDEVVRTVVPFARELLQRYGVAAGFDRVYLWDEGSLAADAHVAPHGDLGWTIARTREALEAIDPSLGSFGEALFAGGMFDVEYRPGKQRGAFCTDIPVRNSPFIFANYAGSARDVRTLMHELGHAFQRWQSRQKHVLDYMYPTSESAEIHSMALEYLSWPQMERLFGENAAAYRRQHLFDAMLFIPYGAAVDHFQHLVYAHPGASPAERHAMWQEVERRYLPWREYGDLAHPLKGGLWQEKQHIYLSPFYYIDYTLALCCALQFWQRSVDDRESALVDYVALCERGGEAPFQTLVRSAGLRSPFEPGALESVVTRARLEL